MQRRCVLRLNTTVWMLVLVLVLGLPVLAQEREIRTPPESYGMPEVLYSSDPDLQYPRWFSLEAAFVGPGEPNPEFFTPSSLRTVKMRWGLELENGCLRLEAFYYQFVNAPPQGTLIQTVQGSDFILHGRVTGRAYGFFGKEPGQLLRLEPLELLVTSAASLAEYFVFYPVGTFVVDGVPVCKTDSRYAHPPDIGDEVFAITNNHFHSAPEDALVEVGAPYGLVTYGEDFGLSLPYRFREQRVEKSDGGPLESREDMIRLLRRYARGGR